jgi:hypothetical protein
MIWEDKIIPFEEDKALGDRILEDERILMRVRTKGFTSTAGETLRRSRRRRDPG